MTTPMKYTNPLQKVKELLLKSHKHFFTEDDIYELNYFAGLNIIDIDNFIEELYNSNLFTKIIYDTEEVDSFESGSIRNIEFKNQGCNQYQEFAIMIASDISEEKIFSQEKINDLFG